MAKKLLWLVLDTQFGPVPVWVKKKLKGGAAGYYTWSKRKLEITIAEDHPLAMKMTLFHEILHGALRPYSGHVRQKIVGTVSMKREELIVGMFEPTLYDLLNRNGLIKLPNPPRFPKRKKG